MCVQPYCPTPISIKLIVGSIVVCSAKTFPRKSKYRTVDVRAFPLLRTCLALKEHMSKLLFKIALVLICHFHTFYMMPKKMIIMFNRFLFVKSEKNSETVCLLQLP
jgi:hypothetical protein